MTKMRRWQGWALWTVAAIGLLALLASLALQALSDEARLRAIVHDKVQQSWGRDVQIKSLRWQLLPSPRLHAHGVVVANAAWAQGRHLLEIEDISARLAPWPLLNGKAVIRRLDFDGVTVNLEAAPDGRRNWDAVEKTGAGVHAQWRQQLAELTDLRITNGHILYRDGAQKAAAWELRKFRADTDRGLRKLSFNMALERDGHPLQLSGNFDDLSQLGMAGARTKGQLSAHSGEAAVTLEGMLPLSSDAPFDLRVALDARSLKEAFGFFHLEHGLPAVVQASAELHGTVQGVTVSNAQVQLGRSTVSGKGAWRRGSKPAFDAQLHADYIDMEQTFLDAGLPPLPPKPEGELFHDSPLPWPLLVALDGTQGKAELQVDQLRLRSNVTVRQAAAAMRFDGDRMSVTHFRGDLLGGSAEGDAVLEGRRQAVQLNLRLHGTQLGAWFRESGRKLDISGGAMEVDARLSTSGRSMKALAAGISGPTNIRIGPAKILSEKAGRAEFWMNGLFSARDANRIDLSCASLRLPFKSGVAQGDGIAGARSEASQLLSSGRVDLRREEVDLRGRLRARSGVHLGISSFAGDIKIVGKIAKPQWSLDETNVGSVLARIGAAILTSGVSIVATAIWDGANPASDPCQLVFSRSRAAKK